MIFFLLALAQPVWAAHDQPSDRLPHVVKEGRSREVGLKPRVRIVLEKGWKLNGKAPSWLALYDLSPEAGAMKVAEIDRPALAHGAAELPELRAGGNYRLQGTIYFCESRAESVCLIQSLDLKLEAREGAEKSLALRVTQPRP